MAEIVVVSEKLNANEEQQALVERIAITACQKGNDVLIIPDVYHIDENSTIWQELKALPARVTLWAWHHPRPLRWLLVRHGINAHEWQIFDLRLFSPDDKTMPLSSVQVLPPKNIKRLTEKVQERWHPVIDEQLCQQCGHCVEFCLFGVYGYDARKRVCVLQPDHCKPGCPACARICPQGAIMFPLYDKEPAIAGAPGTKMSLDAAGRRLYYARTGKSCSVCGKLTEDQWAALAGEKGECPECGRKLPAPSKMWDEIDALIERLDRLNGGGNP